MNSRLLCSGEPSVSVKGEMIAVKNRLWVSGKLLSGYKRKLTKQKKVEDVSDIELGLIFSIIKNAMPLTCGYASEEARYFHGAQPYGM